jgi:hypothetical protein
LGTFAFAGATAALRRTHKLNAIDGSFLVTGQAAGLLRALRLSAESGAAMLTGSPAALTYSGGAETYTLAAQAGTISITFTAAGLSKQSAPSGSFVPIGGGVPITQALKSLRQSVRQKQKRKQDEEEALIAAAAHAAHMRRAAAYAALL